MKYTHPSTPFEVVLGDAPSGLAGTLGLTLISKSSVVTPRVTAGVIEYPAGSGIYQYTHPGTSTSGYLAALWDTGSVTPTTTAVEEVVVSPTLQAAELTVAPGGSFDAVAANWPTGLVGTMHVRVVDNIGNTTFGPSTAAITEYPASSGVYWASLDAPLIDGDYTIVFDDGSDTPGHDAVLGLTVGIVTTGGGGGVGPVLPSSICGPMMPWLSFCGIEITNAARVASYISLGLAPSGHYIANPASLPSILWRTTGSPEVFTSPAIDDAPWYDPLLAESGDFLGFICDRVSGLDTTETRTSTASGSYRGGGILDAATLPEREFVLHGYLVSQTEPGVEYGRRWLADVLGANPSACSDCNIAVRVTAPPDDGSNDRQGLWNLYRCALRNIQVTDPFRCPDLREVTVTLVCGDPVLYKDALVCQDHAVLSPSAGDAACIPFDEWYCGLSLDAPICCTVAPVKVGRVAAIVTLGVETSYFGGARITLNDTCSGISGAAAGAEVAVGPLPTGSSITIDAARHTVTYVDPGGASWDGTPYLVLPPGKSVPWLEVGPTGSPICICAEPTHPCAGGGGTFVTIETQKFEK